MRRTIGKIFIAVGLLIILVVIYINHSVYQENNKVVEKYRKTSKSEEIDETEPYIDNIVGILNIPKIDLEVVVKTGTGKEILKSSVGHFEGSVMPGEEGNFAIAGHRNYTSNKFLSDLDKLEKNDEIKVESKGKTYRYKVSSIEVVEPEEVSVIDSTEKKEITLVTCTPKFIGSHRLIVKGEYVE